MEVSTILRRVLYVLPIVSAAVIIALEVLPWGGPPPHEATTRLPVVPEESPASRVVKAATPGISLASLILALGGPDALVAVAPEVKANPWLRRVLSGTDRLATPFVRPAGFDREALLAVRPDLVVMWDDGSSPMSGLEDTSGITVLRIAYADPAHMMEAVRRLGKALGPGAEHKADEWVREFEHNQTRVVKALTHLPEDAKPRVYYASIAPLLTEGSGTMVDAWITSAGGINVAARGGMRGNGMVHFEDVLAWNPDIIITQRNEERIAILADPRWHEISAIRNRRIVVNPGGVNAWCTRAAEASLQVLWAAQVFHPEQFQDLDLGLETRRFYRQFYRYDLDADELARVLHGDGPGPAKATSNGDKS